MKTIQDFKKQVLEERHGVHTYEDWDDFIDDATLTEILELNDKAWQAYADQFRSQHVEQEQEIDRLKEESKAYYDDWLKFSGLYYECASENDAHKIYINKIENDKTDLKQRIAELKAQLKEQLKDAMIDISERDKRIAELEAQLNRVKDICSNQLSNFVAVKDIQKALESSPTEQPDQKDDDFISTPFGSMPWPKQQNQLEAQNLLLLVQTINHLLESRSEEYVAEWLEKNWIVTPRGEPQNQPEEQDCICPPYECLLGKATRCKLEPQNQPQPEKQEQEVQIQTDYTDYHVEIWNEVLDIVAPYEENKGPLVYNNMINCLNRNFTITRKQHE